MNPYGPAPSMLAEELIELLKPFIGHRVVIVNKDARNAANITCPVQSVERFRGEHPSIHLVYDPNKLRESEDWIPDRQVRIVCATR